LADRTFAVQHLAGISGVGRALSPGRNLVAFYIGGAGVPSDHLATGTKKMVSGSGTKRKGATTTGEPSKFAPQLAPSVFGM
jgi:hypothetical protein